MNTLLNDSNLATLFGLDELTEIERAELLDDIGMTIIESAMLRHLTELDEVESEHFEEMLAESSADEDSFQKILEEFPRFAELLDEEAKAFRQEAQAVLA